MFSLVDSSNLFKIKYAKISENTYNSYNVLLGRVKKSYDFVGKRMDRAVPTSYAGGVGSGSLPTANGASYEDAQLTSKKVYSRIQVEREALAAASRDEGAFVRMTKEPTKKGVESFNRNLSRILFNDGTGALGAGDGSTNVTGAGTSGSPYVVVIGSASWKKANWEEKDYVNYDAETTNLEVVAVVPSTRTVKLVGTSAGLAALVAGPGPVPTNKSFYMQGSKGNDPMGLKGALQATSGSLYGVTVGRRWQAYQNLSVAKAINPDLIDDLMLGVEEQCGIMPKLIITSYKQFKKIKAFQEDQKRYMMDARATNLKGKVSFAGLSYMGPKGEVGIFADRFCEDDTMYGLNDDFIEICHRPGSPSWADEDGAVFSRVVDSDNYEARYALYGEAYIPPSFHGVITGLT